MHTCTCINTPVHAHVHVHTRVLTSGTGTVSALSISGNTENQVECIRHCHCVGRVGSVCPLVRVAPSEIGWRRRSPAGVRVLQGLLGRFLHGLDPGLKLLVIQHLEEML